MSSAHAWSRPRPGALATLSVVGVLATTLAGCLAAGDAVDDETPDGADTSLVTGDELQVRTSITRVHGELAAGPRRQLERQAEHLLEGYLSAAYLKQRPTAGYRSAFPGFTADARELALHDVETASDGAYQWAEGISPLGATASLSVVAAKGRPAGATARVLLRVEVSDDRRKREVTVRGRLLLTPAGERWEIFGYDLSVASTPVKRSSR